MSRIPGIDLETADAYAKRVFELQVERWGAPLLNHLVYARRPTTCEQRAACGPGSQARG